MLLGNLLGICVSIYPFFIFGVFVQLFSICDPFGCNHFKVRPKKNFSSQPFGCACVRGGKSGRNDSKSLGIVERNRSSVERILDKTIKYRLVTNLGGKEMMDLPFPVPSSSCPFQLLGQNLSLLSSSFGLFWDQKKNVWVAD